jgi:hypothetical protein
LAARNQPILEFSHGCPKNRRDPLSSKNSLSTIARAEINLISGGGILCNTSIVRREESVTFDPNSPLLGWKLEGTQVSTSSEVHSSFRNIDPFLIIEGGRDSILPICNGSDSKKSVGDVAREGMELTRGGRHTVSLTTFHLCHPVRLV